MQRTATPYPFTVAELRPGNICYLLNQQLAAVGFDGRPLMTSYVMVALDETGTTAWPVDCVGDARGPSVFTGVMGTTHETVLAALGYNVGQHGLFTTKTRRTPSRTHLNISVDGKRAACGQLNGTRTDIAQTFYTGKTEHVTCQKCMVTQAFARAMAKEGQESLASQTPAVSEYDAVDRKAWRDALDDHQEGLQVLRARFEVFTNPRTGETKHFALAPSSLTKAQRARCRAVAEAMGISFDYLDLLEKRAVERAGPHREELGYDIESAQ